MNEWAIITIQLAVGIGVIWAGSNLMVDGVRGLALNLRMPAVVVGYTLVAFGTSLPELLVGIEAAALGKISMSVGNLASAQLINGLLLLGLAGAAGRIVFGKYIKTGQAVFVVFATASLGAVIMYGSLSRSFAAVMFAVFAVYAVYTYRDILGHLKKQARQDEKEKPGKPVINGLKSLVGIALLAIGGKLLLDGAGGLAALTGLASGFIGFTIVTLGTTAPELVSSFVALRKGRVDILIGCGAGSAIFNPLFIAGTAGLLNTGIPQLDTKPVMGMTLIIAAAVTGFQLLAMKEFDRRFMVVSVILTVVSLAAVFYG